MRVVVDTNSLPRDASAPSAAFQRLVTLVGEGVVEVHIPHVVAEEWRTQQREHLRKHLQKIEAGLKDVTGSAHLAGHADLPNLRAGAAAAARVVGNVDALSRAALDRLMQQLGTQAIQVPAAHADRVLRSYFGGDPPFSGLKNRQDLPDAFVFETIRDLVGVPPNDGLSVITADANLRKHAAAIAGVTCYESLEAFVASPQVQVQAAQIQLEAQWAAALPEASEQVRQYEEVLKVDVVSSLINAVAGSEVTHSSLPSDNSDATISMVSDPEYLEFVWGETEGYGPRLLRVPFRCICEVSLDLYVYYADAYGLPDKFSVSYSDPDDRPYFDVQANATLAVRGFALITLSNWPEEVAEESTAIVVDQIVDLELVADNDGNAV